MYILIDFLFSFSPLTLVIVSKAKNSVKHSHTGKDKENVSQAHNEQKKAIVAVSRVENPTRTANLRKMFQKSLTINAEKPSTLPQQKGGVLNVKVEAVTRPQMKKSISSDMLGNRLFEYAEIARKRRETLALKLKQEQERELKFTFHAQPAPKFKKSLALQKSSIEPRRMQKQVSLPQIPLNNSKMSKENFVPKCGDPDRIKLLNERKKSLLSKYSEPQVSFKAKPAKVLKKLPFQPTYNPVKAPEAKPFKLQLSDRLTQRQEFNKKNMETVSTKKLQEESKKHQQDLQKLKLIRQKTEFKARPNPFRNVH